MPGTKIGPIVMPRSDLGTYIWNIPGFPQNYMCTMQYPNGLCGISIPTGKYYIKGTATSDAFSTTATTYATAQTGLFTITTITQ